MKKWCKIKIIQTVKTPNMYALRGEMAYGHRKSSIPFARIPFAFGFIPIISAGRRDPPPPLILVENNSFSFRVILKRRCVGALWVGLGLVVV
jgi:hypothetical protein